MRTITPSLNRRLHCPVSLESLLRSSVLSDGHLRLSMS